MLKTNLHGIVGVGLVCIQFLFRLPRLLESYLGYRQLISLFSSMSSFQRSVYKQCTTTSIYHLSVVNWGRRFKRQVWIYSQNTKIGQLRGGRGRLFLLNLRTFQDHSFVFPYCLSYYVNSFTNVLHPPILFVAPIDPFPFVVQCIKTYVVDCCHSFVKWFKIFIIIVELYSCNLLLLLLLHCSIYSTNEYRYY